MISAVNTSLTESAINENVGGVLTQHREELEWLANFLLGDEKIAEVCVIDACALAESVSLGVQDWPLKWACLTMIQSAVQMQQRRITQLAAAYKQRGCIHGGHTALSSDWRDILVEESSVLLARLDVLSRFVLVICGLQKRSTRQAAVLLGVDRISVEGAYCAAIKFLEVIGCEQFQRQNKSAAVYN
ncbi:MAG: hypothetical protein ACLPHP_16500 [Candidatus Sulfotelmatobacter sp.]